MELISIITVFLFLGSCNQSSNEQNSKPIEAEKIEIKQNKQFNIDSVFVHYWKSTEANEYYFRYTTGILKIKSEYFSFERKIENKGIYEQFLKFIDDLYVNNEPIIFSRKEEPSLVSDYPIIEVVGFLKGKQIFQEKTTLYSNIEFNPKFLEFYEFLDNLVKKE